MKKTLSVCCHFQFCFIEQCVLIKKMNIYVYEMHFMNILYLALCHPVCSGMQNNICALNVHTFIISLTTVLGVLAIVEHNCCLCLSTWNNMTPTRWIFMKFNVRNFLIKSDLFISLPIIF